MSPAHGSYRGSAHQRSAGYATSGDAPGVEFLTELIMTKSIFVCLAVLTLSTSAVLAAQRHHSAAAPVTPSPAMGGVSSSDHAMHMKNLRASGYNPRSDFNKNGILEPN